LIRRALISVYDKTGVVELARRLDSLGIEIISTGGTFSLLKKEGISVNSVESLTGFPEILGGRVKTLHPAIFGGILADRSNPVHSKTLSEMSFGEIDLVVVNLYPFSQTISRDGVKLSEAIEMIDVGGVTLMRAAAKNFMHVDVLTSPGQYAEYIGRLTASIEENDRNYAALLASRAFRITSDYDRLISAYLSGQHLQGIEAFAADEFSGKPYIPLRYGENPHQQAVLVKDNFDDVFEILHGKEISYNNLLDINAAYDLISDLRKFGTACAIIKHGNPSGAAIGSENLSAYLRAFETDTVSPFGGIIAFNQKLDFNTSVEVDKLFTEIILAPDFEESALELLKKKKNRRLIRFRFIEDKYETRSIRGGILVQEKDNKAASVEGLKFVTKRKATGEDLKDMLFAEMICKHTRSNAIVFAKNLMTLGIGAGQPSRIDSTKIAVSKAAQFGHDLSGSTAASDAFFPFADGIKAIAESGAKFVIQPGGSVRDEEVIAEADTNDMAMAFTGIRHFKH
jgi:phosphoribosylaminoimidazolecarboxamide formyltransferase/IMP cyclohydrolase